VVIDIYDIMEKYRLVPEQQHKPTELEMPPEGQRLRQQHTESGFPEVRITQQGKPRNYISYAMSLLVRGCSHVVIIMIASSSSYIVEFFFFSYLYLF
jgi:hypothetical protein